MSELSSELEGVQTPGTWRVSDGTAVPFKDATSAWAAAAFDVLVDVASNYHAFITYKDLAEKVQASTGIRSRSQMRNWIGGVLGQVVDRAAAEGLPSLTALCVKQDQSVGDGYRYVLEVAGLEIPEDLDQHAAEARLECYKYFGAVIPSDGGVPALPPAVIAQRRRAKPQPEPIAPLCPTCRVQLPCSGICDDH